MEEEMEGILGHCIQPYLLHQYRGFDRRARNPLPRKSYRGFEKGARNLKLEGVHHLSFPRSVSETASHDEHPLIRVEIKIGGDCNGCRRYITDGEAAYRCSKKYCFYRLHEECAEMPRRIRHPMHPQHLLTIQPEKSTLGDCAVCTKYEDGLVYSCAVCACLYQIHLACAAASTGVVPAADDDEEEKQYMIQHPSHPQHELRLLKRPWKSCSFKCDGCGTIEKGDAYVCITCQFMIHKSCASLPTTIKSEEHHHPLSLAFRLPIEYIRHYYSCGICSKALPLGHWAYNCEFCLYVVHIECALGKSPATTAIKDAGAANEEEVIQFPINDGSEELLRPFVVRERGELVNPRHDQVNSKFDFPYHNHQLILISKEENQEEKDDDDDDIIGYRRSELICDACTTPIYQKKKTQLESSSSSSSSSSSDKCSNYYMSCGECKYFLHWACFNLPREVPSLPIHNKQHHKLTLKTCPELELTLCCVCQSCANGLVYACTEDCCKFIADVKCASLPNTIKHSAHQNPRHYLKMTDPRDYRGKFCVACLSPETMSDDTFYTCGSCNFSLHCGCAVLPAVANHRWDKHQLPLTYDARVNHPSEFYCDICEEEMEPKKWMYHCRECDHSFHPHCLPATTGFYRNIKFGQKYVIIPTCYQPHDHPLTFQLIPPKRRCSLCHQCKYYHHQPAFQCAPCNFVMCFYTCGRLPTNAVLAID